MNIFDLNVFLEWRLIDESSLNFIMGARKWLLLENASAMEIFRGVD